MNDLFVLLNSYALEYAAGDKTHENEFILTCYESVKAFSKKKCFSFIKKYGTVNMELDEFCWGVTETALLSIAGYKPQYAFISWLYVIGLNALRAKYKACKKHNNLSLEELIRSDGEETDTPLIDMLASGEDIEREFLRREALRILHDGIEFLPDNRRLAITNCYLKERRRKDAAADLGVTETALNNHLKRGSDNLEDFCYENDIAEDLLYEPDI